MMSLPININKQIIKISENLKLLFHPVIINAFIYYNEDGTVKKENWGDDLNYFFIKEIINKKLVLFNRSSIAIRLKLKNYLVVGSIIDMLCTSKTEVWGAGIINENADLINLPAKVYAVRGPLTRKKLLERHIECPEIYGDPALLLPMYYKPEKKLRYRYGIISHVSNQDYLNKLTYDGIPVNKHKDILIISMREYNDWHDIVDKICSCQAILSSSLHGLIVAEAYRIANVWIEFGKPLIGKHFKFHDFFLSINRDRKNPLTFDGHELPIKSIDDELSLWQAGDIDLQPLLQSCPFKIRKPLYYQ